MTNVRAAPRDRVDARTAAAVAAVVVMPVGHHVQTAGAAAGGRTGARVPSAVEGRNAAGGQTAGSVQRTAAAAVDVTDRAQGGDGMRDALAANSANPAQ